MAEAVRFVSAEEVRKVLTYQHLIPVLEDTLKQYSVTKNVKIIQPCKTLIEVKENNGLCLIMPCYSAADNIIATKLVTVFPQNKDIPSHDAAIVVFSSTNGKLLSVIDGTVITAMRTAAVTVIATKYLSVPEPKVLAIIGSGVQARSHFAALTTSFTFSQVNVWSRNKANARMFGDDTGAKVCGTIEEAVKDADVIVTATGSKQPLLMKDWVKAGTHINAVGAPLGECQEVDSELTRSSIVYVEDYEMAHKYSGELGASKAEVFGEIGEVIGGQKQNFRNKNTMFISLGMAIEDCVSAKLVYKNITNNL
ncbi:ketimine reductase mu-crystallin isoform X1 [Octopus sinensis]|uniref:Ketimine reductase mu-crystallin n=1 Tax=Octopus sinensis TaxID=2607531 RepID=A0A6P7SHN2_9MOLL|nr:ketimine reductase mu-crystallin isoform X1 [Octopus sinensis]